MRHCLTCRAAVALACCRDVENSQLTAIATYRNVSEAQQKCALQFGPATVGALAAHLSGCHVCPCPGWLSPLLGDASDWLHPCLQVTLFAACFLAAVLEYLAAEVMELAGNAARDCQRRFITNRHIFLAISNDAELVAL